jgi:hypothetical protein
MKKGAILTLLILIIFPGYLAAQNKETTETSSQNSIWPQMVKVGGEFRMRPESQFNFNLNSAVPDNDTFLLLRTRVYLDLNPTSYVQLFAMYQDSETIDQGPALVKTPDRHKFYQGFAQFTNEAKLTTRFKVGRQELNYGDQRLIGGFDFGNLGRSFDGAVVRFENSDFFLDLFGTRIHPAAGIENQFAGAYGHWKKFPRGELEPYALYLHGSKSGLNNGQLNLATIGTRIKAKFKKNFDYAFEGAYQIGESTRNLDSAFAMHVRMGYTFPLSFKPRLGWEYDFASGDGNPGSGKVTTFNNLFPTNHDKYGFIDFFSWRNLHDLRATFSAAPTSFMKASLDYHAFFLPEPADGEFLASGAQGRVGSPTAGHFAAQEIDVLLKFEPIKYFDAAINYSIFFPETFFSDTGPSDIAQYFFVQLAARY